MHAKLVKIREIEESEQNNLLETYRERMRALGWECFGDDNYIKVRREHISAMLYGMLRLSSLRISQTMFYVGER